MRALAKERKDEPLQVRVDLKEWALVGEHATDRSSDLVNNALDRLKNASDHSRKRCCEVLHSPRNSLSNATEDSRERRRDALQDGPQRSRRLTKDVSERVQHTSESL